jgi:hypothetical protein
MPRRADDLGPEFWDASNQLGALDAGELDHLFADAETKAHLRADLQRELDELVEAALRANPGMFEELPNGCWKLRGNNVVPLERRR